MKGVIMKSVIMKSVIMKSAITKNLVAIYLSLLANTGFALSRSIDDVLPPEKRICGLLASSSEDGTESYTLSTEDRLVFVVDGPAPIRDGFANIIRRYPAGLEICVPTSPDTLPDPASPLWVEWFAYIDPGASGVSVVNQRTTDCND